MSYANKVLREVPAVMLMEVVPCLVITYSKFHFRALQFIGEGFNSKYFFDFHTNINRI